MKVKHWSGYGCVEARLLAGGGAVRMLEVWGNHEQGLEPRYFNNSDWERWLGKRFRLRRPVLVQTRTWWSDKDHQDHMYVSFWY